MDEGFLSPKSRRTSDGWLYLESLVCSLKEKRLDFSLGGALWLEKTSCGHGRRKRQLSLAFGLPGMSGSILVALALTFPFSLE